MKFFQHRAELLSGVQVDEGEPQAIGDIERLAVASGNFQPPSADSGEPPARLQMLDKVGGLLNQREHTSGSIDVGAMLS